MPGRGQVHSLSPHAPSEWEMEETSGASPSACGVSCARCWSAAWQAQRAKVVELLMDCWCIFLCVSSTLSLSCSLPILPSAPYLHVLLPAPPALAQCSHAIPLSPHASELHESLFLTHLTALYPVLPSALASCSSLPAIPCLILPLLCLPPRSHTCLLPLLPPAPARHLHAAFVPSPLSSCVPLLPSLPTAFALPPSFLSHSLRAPAPALASPLVPLLLNVRTLPLLPALTPSVLLLPPLPYSPCLASLPLLLPALARHPRGPFLIFIPSSSPCSASMRCLCSLLLLPLCVGVAPASPPPPALYPALASMCPLRMRADLSPQAPPPPPPPRAGAGTPPSSSASSIAGR
ncbi:hypothetical protein B0H13DRAFT_2360496 [Mycena leptocephala]|nr:hypothetical protein B0H13DRAFT_2360496 [Mycena leptocephala]